MRKLFISLAITAVAMNVSAATESADTVKVIGSASNITVTSSPDGTKLTIKNPDGSEDYTYTYTVKTSPVTTPDSTAIDFRLPFESKKDIRPRRWSFTTMGIYCGGSMSHDAVKGVGNGWELGIASLFGVRYSPTRSGFSINTGLGFGYRKMSINDGMQLDSEGRGRLVLVPSAENQQKTSSRIEMFTLHIPVMLRQTTWTGGAITAGALLNLNTYAVGFTRYMIDNRQITHTFKHLHQQMFTVDLIAAVTLVEDLGVYLRWSPSNPFKSSYGPTYGCLSIGGCISF
ncbi:MAG: hypothetical protein NC098_08380 [Lachnoclostridium sp.]|nr:hypothetical protein [Lachnoclostridium sp.]